MSFVKIMYIIGACLNPWGTLARITVGEDSEESWLFNRTQNEWFARNDCIIWIRCVEMFMAEILKERPSFRFCPVLPIFITIGCVLLYHVFGYIFSHENPIFTYILCVSLHILIVSICVWLLWILMFLKITILCVCVSMCSVTTATLCWL